MRFQLRVLANSNSSKPLPKNSIGTIGGRAISFEEYSQPLLLPNFGQFIEIIDKNAVTKDVFNRSYPISLNTHQLDQVLGSAVAGTLRFSVDDQGVNYEVDVPDTTYGRDLMISVERGDIAGSSFGFSVRSHKDDGIYNDLPVRRILEFEQILEFSPTAIPAYRNSTVSLRAKDLWHPNQVEQPALIQQDVLLYYQLNL